MRRSIIILVILSLVCCFNVSAGDKNKKKEYNYELAPVGIGSQGTVLIKVYSYAKNVKEATLLAKENAVHGILFKGVVGGKGVSTIKPMVSPEAKSAHEDFFQEFFNNGTYERFVNLSNDGTIDPNDQMKVGKLYKIGVVVSVSKDELRKYLESQGVIKKLGSIF